MFGLTGMSLVLASFAALLVFILVVWRVTRLYHRVPPNRVMVIYGRGRTLFDEEGRVRRLGVRLVTGGGALVWPVLEDFGFLDLTVMTIAQAKDEVYTVDGGPT